MPCFDRQLRAQHDGADIDWIVGALFHDTGDGLTPQNHKRMSAEVIRPFLRRDVFWVVEHHGIFQMLHYGLHYGCGRNARNKYSDHPCFDSRATFRERRVQASFDPDYNSLPLDHFVPMVREVFGRRAYAETDLRQGDVTPFVAA